MRRIDVRWVPAMVVAITLMTFGALDPAAGLDAAMQKPAKPVASSPASIKEGMRAYATWCRSCHGLRARGDGVTAPPGAKPANLVDAEWKYGSSDAEIFRNIRQGIKPFEFMKPQKELSDTDIWNIINYLRSLAQEPKK
jgi:mono/diheme cytochrome c family protein